MNKKFILLVLLQMSLVFQLNAQETKKITLTDAVQLSLQNSKQLKYNKAKIDEAKAATKEAADKKLPSANVSGSYLRLNNANINIEQKNNNSGSGNTGGSPKASQAVYGILNISLPIYNGGKIKYGIESSVYLEKAAELDLENNKDEVIQNTIEAYANLFKVSTTVGLVKENLLQSQQRVKDLTNLEKNGLLARNDLLKAELQSSAIELNLVDAENNRQIANVNMDLLLGLPATTALILDTTGIERKKDDRMLDEYVKIALDQRKDIMATALRKKAAETGVKTVKSDLYPSLQLTGGYIAADVPNVFTVTNAVNIGAGVSYNIANLWKSKAKIDQAEARVKEVSITQDMMADNILLDVNKKYLTLLSDRKKIIVYALAQEQANENYRIMKNKFDNSLATTTELLEADVAKLQAALAYRLAQADAFVAYHKLLQAAGILSAEYIK